MEELIRSAIERIVTWADLRHHVFMLSRASTLLAVLIASALLSSAQKMQLPKPQVPSAVGQPAPNFTLSDQDGKPFKLSDLRGSKVLLIFYRGYW